MNEIDINKTNISVAIPVLNPTLDLNLWFYWELTQKGITGKNVLGAQGVQAAFILHDTDNFAVQKPLEFKDYFIPDFAKWNKKEFYYCTGMKNLIKKNEYLQLSLQFAEKIIDEEEYKNEITANPDKYTIKMAPLKDNRDVVILGEIINSLKYDFTIDDVSEIFSIDYNDLKNNISEINNQ